MSDLDLGTRPGYDEDGIPLDLPRFDFQSPDWMADGACLDTPNPDIFHSGRPADVARAKAICEGCPVKAQCLDYGESFPNSQFENVFGGMTYDERRAHFGPRPRGPAPRSYSQRALDALQPRVSTGPDRERDAAGRYLRVA